AIAANKANKALIASAQPARRPVQKPPCCEGSPNGNSSTGSVMIRNIAWTLLSIANVAKKAAMPISIGLAAMREERAEISKMSNAMAKNAPERSSGLTDRTDIAIPPENAIANVPSSATRQSSTKARSRRADADTYTRTTSRQRRRELWTALVQLRVNALTSLANGIVESE